MDSPPASLESQRSQRDFFFLSLSPARKQWDVNRGKKLKTHAFRKIVSPTIFTLLRIRSFLRLGRIVLYVCRPLNGKHKTNILCVLCGSAVNNILNLNRKCLNNYYSISNWYRTEFKWTRNLWIKQEKINALRPVLIAEKK
jgi:hypothetical protein